MALHTLSGAIGTGIIIGAYFPEIARLVRTRRSDGVSISSYLLWSGASGLLLVHAWGIAEPKVHLSIIVPATMPVVAIIAFVIMEGLRDIAGQVRVAKSEHVKLVWV